jgi:hypothetical protein
MVDKMFCNEDFFEVYEYIPTFDESWDVLNKKCIDPSFKLRINTFYF